MKIQEKDIKMWSVIGSRATFGIAALEIAKKNKNLITLTCDVSTSAGLDRYRKILPDQYVDLGIAEQNMIGVAAGLASENFNVITTTFAPFQTMRCCEQIKVNIGYMKQNICMVGLASGLALGPLGFTHCCIEDIGVLRNIPGLTIISPADSLETVKALNEVIISKKPTYIRLTGSSNNPIYGKNIKLDCSLIGDILGSYLRASPVEDPFYLPNFRLEHLCERMSRDQPKDGDVLESLGSLYSLCMYFASTPKLWG